jgi:hypothetical protein
MTLDTSLIGLRICDSGLSCPFLGFVGRQRLESLRVSRLEPDSVLISDPGALVAPFALHDSNELVLARIRQRRRRCEKQ